MLLDNPGQLTFPGQRESPGDLGYHRPNPTPTDADSRLRAFRAARVWDSGFGIQANWSCRSGGAGYNPSSSAVSSRGRVEPLYNVVGFFENTGVQTRVAYTHRGEFLSALLQTQQANERCTRKRTVQLDVSASYAINSTFPSSSMGSTSRRPGRKQHGRYSSSSIRRLRGSPATRSDSARLSRLPRTRGIGGRAARRDGPVSRVSNPQAACARGSVSRIAGCDPL